MRKIADQADEQLADATGYSLTDLGIDPLTFVEWMLVDFDYKLDGAYDNGDGTGTIELAVHGIDQDGTLFWQRALLHHRQEELARERHHP